MGWSFLATNNKMKPLLRISILLLFLTACQSNSEVLGAVPTDTAVQSTETVLPQMGTPQSEITSAWETSAHAQTSTPVQCADCHPDENGIVSEKLSWRNPQSGQYEVMSDASSLCRKCHDVGSFGSTHASLTCVDCHDPHRIKSSCTNSGCHADIPTVFYELPATPTGGHPKVSSSFCGGPNCHSAATAVAQTATSIHGPAHAKVSCLACHDAGHMQTGPSPEDGRWYVWDKVDADEESADEPYISHDIQLDVDCSRCHFEGNSWGLGLVSGDEFKE
jgi:hypothetical protein